MDKVASVCSAILKSGRNQGMRCRNKATRNGKCGVHLGIRDSIYLSDEPDNISPEKSVPELCSRVVLPQMKTDITLCPATLEVLADNFLTMFPWGYNFHLTCKQLYARSCMSNLTRMFFSFSPVRCTATALLRRSYAKIDSNIPYVTLQEVCVLGKVAEGEETNNNVCVVGPTSDVAGYFLSLLSVGICFQRLEIYPRKAFKSRRGRQQYLDLGYGNTIGLGTTNVVRFGDKHTEPPYKAVAPQELLSARELDWDRR